MDLNGPIPTVLPARQPLGLFTVSVDSNGRLKLPVKIREFLEKFPDKTFFCTSLDERMGLIYPLPVWDNHQQFLDSAEDRVRARRVKFLAQDLGAEIDVDPNGRMTLPPRLRNRLKITGAQEVRMMVDRGVVQILTQAVYDEINPEGKGDLVGDVEALETAGLGKGIR